MLHTDILQIIVLFLDNEKDAMTFRHICKLTFQYPFNVNCICHNFNPYILCSKVRLYLNRQLTNEGDIYVSFIQSEMKKYKKITTYLDTGNTHYIRSFRYLENLDTLILRETYNVVRVLKNIKHLEFMAPSHLAIYHNRLNLSVAANLVTLKVTCATMIKFNTIAINNKITTLEVMCDLSNRNNKCICNLKNITKFRKLKNFKLCNVYNNEFMVSIWHFNTITNEDLQLLPNMTVWQAGAIIMEVNKISYLPNLRVMSLGMSKISSLPITLTHLYCDFICATDDLIINLVNLIYLNCGNNSLITNNGMIKMSKLQILECSYNTEITVDVLQYLPSLKTIICTIQCPIYYCDHSVYNVCTDISRVYQYKY